MDGPARAEHRRNIRVVAAAAGPRLEAPAGVRVTRVTHRYILLGGYPPFYDDDHEQLYERIKAGVYEFHEEFWSKISSEAKDFINKLLTVNPDDRATATDLLAHPWVVQDGEKISGTSLQTNLKELKQFQARKRFKAAARAIIATHRIKMAFGIGGGAPAPKKVEGGFNTIYDVGRELGTGALSIVKQATHRETGKKYACKCVKKHQLNLEDRESLLAEAQLMKELDHPNIVKLHGVYDENQSYYLVMDMIQGGELFDRIVKKEFYSEKEARDLILVLLKILVYASPARLFEASLTRPRRGDSFGEVAAPPRPQAWIVLW